MTDSSDESGVAIRHGVSPLVKKGIVAVGGISFALLGLRFFLSNSDPEFGLWFVGSTLLTTFGVYNEVDNPSPDLDSMPMVYIPAAMGAFTILPAFGYIIGDMPGIAGLAALIMLIMAILAVPLMAGVIGFVVQGKVIAND